MSPFPVSVILHLSNGAYPVSYKVVATNGQLQSTPTIGGTSIPAIPFAINRAAVGVKITNAAGLLRAVTITWAETIYDQFGNPLPNAPVLESIATLNYHALHSDPGFVVVGVGAKTGPFGNFIDTSAEVFYDVTGFISLKQRLVVGSRHVIFYTRIDALGSTAGSTIRALFVDAGR